jgi:hypothetical protein
LAENLRKIHEGEAFGDANQDRIDEARARMPGYKTGLGEVLGTGVEVAGDIARMEAIPGVGPALEQFAENINRGGPAALKSAAAIRLMQVAGVGAGELAKMLELSPAGRQVLVRAVQGHAGASFAAADGAKGRELLKSFAVGAAFPVGEGERVEREPVAPKIAPTERTAHLSYLDMPDIPVTTPEGVRVVKRAQAETGASEAAPGENLPVEGQQASNGPVVEPVHHSEIQPRAEDGQFRKVTTADLREAREAVPEVVNDAAIDAGGRIDSGIPTGDGVDAPPVQSRIAVERTPSPATGKPLTRPEYLRLGELGWGSSDRDALPPDVARLVIAHQITGTDVADVINHFRAAGRGEALQELVKEFYARVRAGAKTREALMADPRRSFAAEQAKKGAAVRNEAVPEGVNVEPSTAAETVPVAAGSEPVSRGGAIRSGADAVPDGAAGSVAELSTTTVAAPAPRVAQPARGLTRNYRAGTNDATLQFSSAEQRDLYDLGAKMRYLTRGGKDTTNKRAVGDIQGLREGLAKRLGLPAQEVSRLATETHNDVKAQMRGVKHLEERKVVDNVRQSNAAAVNVGEVAPVRSVDEVRKSTDIRQPEHDAPPVGHATAPDPARLRDSFKQGIVRHFHLPEHQAEAVATVTDALDEGLSKWGLERGSLLGKVSVESGKGEGAELNQAAPQTPEFKRWFGASKVVDEKGEPLALYHGTRGDFTSFDLSKFGQTDGGSWGKGIYLSQSPAKASEYARGSDYARAVGRPNDGTIMPVFVRMRNPISPTALERVEADLYRNHTLSNGETWADALRNKLIALGHDGVYEPKTDRVMVLHPEQIKSTTGNRGTFDPSDPNILRQSNRAATSFLKDGRAVIRALDNPNVSSGAHEIHHVFAPKLAEATLKTPDANLRETGEVFFKWLGFKGADEFSTLHQKWVDGTLSSQAKRALGLGPEATADEVSAAFARARAEGKNFGGLEYVRYVDGQEQGARGFERYLKTGKAPSEKLAKVFADFKEWLTNIYGSIRGKSHPLNVKLSEEAIRAWDSVLGAPKGEHGQLTHQLHKAPSEGTPAFFENAQVKRALGLKPDASTEDVRWRLADAVGKPRSSHITPEDLTKWVESKGLRGAAREALDASVAKYRETIKAPTEYQQTGIRKSHYDPAEASVSEAVRAMGGLRITDDNRGEMKRLNDATTGLTRRSGGVGADEMIVYLKEDGYFPAEEDVSIGDLLTMLEEDALGIRKYHSNQKEHDYEAEYRRQNPGDSTEALEAFVLTEEGGKLFDKVHDGQASRRETAEFRRAAGEAGIHPEHVAAIIARGQGAKAENVQGAAGSRPEDDFDFRDDPLDDGDAAPWLYQSSHKPEQLGFTQDELVSESPSRTRDLSAYNRSQAKDEPLRRALGDESFGRLRGLQESPVARIAHEVEKRVNAGNAQNAPDVLAALSKLSDLKRQKQTVDDFLNQGSLFGNRELTPAQERILGALDKNPRKVIDEAFPAEAKPEQNTLFQSSDSSSRRQKAYRALLEAKGQLPLEPGMRGEPRSRTRMGANRSTDPNQPALSDDFTPAQKKTPWYNVLTAFHRANLLMAPRTHARNVTSNAAMMGSEEASKPFAVLADAFVARQTGRRTVAAPSIASVARSVKDAAVKGVPEALNVIRHGNPEGSKQQLDEVRSGSKILDTYINGVFRTLEAEDRVFKTYAVRRSLEEQAKVQAMNEKRADAGVNVTARQKELLANPTPAMQAEAVAYAEFATFQNKNAISDTISKLKGKSELGKFAFEQLVPFDKTPTNIMLRVLDYSPAGLAKAGIQYGRAKKRAAQDVTSFMSPAEQKQFAQTFGRGTLGTGVLVLGALLASKGLLAGDVDYKDDQKEYSERRRLGILPGSVRIGDKRIVVSGNPLGNVLKLGATIYEQASRPVPKAAKKEGRGLDVRATRAGKAAVSVLGDQPLVHAAMDYLGSDKSLGQRFAEFAGGYMPAAAAVNEAGEVLDPKQRKAVGFTQTLQKRVPGFRNLLREQENPLGGKEGKGGFSRRFVRAFDPLQVTTQKGKQKRRK